MTGLPSSFRTAGGSVPLFLLFCLAAYGQCPSGTICNVSSWNRSGAQFNFTISDGSALRVDVLDHDVVRVRFSPTGTITENISRAVVTTSWVTVSPSASDDGSVVRIETAALRVEIQKTPCVVRFRRPDGDLILGDDPDRRIQWTGTRTRVHKTTQSGETYVGLGWRTLPLRRNGANFLMRNRPNYGSTEAFYGGVPLWYGLRNGQAYAVFFDDTSWGNIDTGRSSSQYMYFENLGGQVDYYFFAGPAMSTILDQYTRLTGRPFFPPKWAVGYQQCRWSYQPQAVVEDIARNFRNRSIPCDVIYLDIDYMPGGRALQFDSSKFGNPSGMLSALHSQGFRVVANISPFLFTHDAKYNTAASNGYFLRKADGTLHLGWHDYWYFIGGASSGSMAWIDFSRTAARTWWATQHTSFLNHGIDGIWNDLNEPDELGSAWATDMKYNFDGAQINHARTSTQYCLLQTEFSYSTLRNHYGNRRPFVLSRGSYAGLQRYSAVWSGDNNGDWNEDYRRNIPMGLSMSISGQPFNGHDIGGFFGYPDMETSRPSNELYVRWMQSGVFNPFCRQHKDGFGNQRPRPSVEPWTFGTTVENLCREYIGLRYRLLPYLYSLFYLAHTTGAPIQRPTLYDFQTDSQTYTQDYDFLFGPFLLVSPVVQPGATTRQVYLPAGTGWYDWWDDTPRTGGTTVNVPAPLERLPIHVRAGAIIPMGPVVQYTSQTDPTELTIEIWPSTTSTSFSLYEDDGETYDYESGEFAKTVIGQRRTDNTVQVTISARQGQYARPARHFVIKVHVFSGVTSVSANGQPLAAFASAAAFEAGGIGYYHDAARQLSWIRIPDLGTEVSVFLGDTPRNPALIGLY